MAGDRSTPAVGCDRRDGRDRRGHRRAAASRASRSAAAAARIRPFSAAGGSTTGTASARTGSTDPSSAISACGSAQDARWARTASAASASSAPSTNEAARSRTSSQLSSGRVGRVMSVIAVRPPAPAPPSPPPRAGPPHRQQPEAHPALDRAERRGGPLGDLDLGQAPEVGELDGLALDVGQRGERRADGVGVEPRGDLGPHVGEPQRGRRDVLAFGQLGRRPSPSDGIDRPVVDDRRAARSSRCPGPRRSGRHCATRRGRRPGRHPRRGSRHS